MSRRVSFLELIPLLVLLDTTNIPPCESAPVLATNRRVPVEGVSFSFTCTLDAAIGGTALFYKGLTSNQGGCLSSGRCGTSVSGYNVSLDSTSRILTLDIASAVSTRDNGTWRCTDGATGSNSVTLSQFAAVLDWSSVIFSPQLTSLPSSVTPQNTISVSVTTPCAAPAAVITWRYQQGVSSVPSSNTSSTQGPCPSGQVQITSTMSLSAIVSFYNRQVSLTVSVEHDSFDPPTYTKSVTSNTIQFPVPVSSVTLTNIKSENEKIGQEVGQTLTLTCVTSASFPTSVVTWTTLPPGTTPTVSTETTSGVLAKTTSFVTFIVSRSDQGRSIRCQAENVNGQASKQSKKAILEVWFGPEQVDVTMPENSVTLENSDLTLTCGTAGYPNVTFTWDYSDGTPVGGSTGSVAESSTWWSQTITFRPNKDKTAVRCHVRNTITNTTKTLSVSLDVKYPPYEPPSITQFPAVMFEGDQETIRCSVTGGNPLATITWSCPGTGSASVSDSGQTRTSTLSFTVSRSQNGQQCECLGAWQYGGYNYTDVRTFNVSCPTNPQPPKAECNMTGVIAGTAIGTLLITLLIGGLVLAVLNRKGFRFGNVMKEKASPKSRRNPECEENENIGYSSLDQISSPAQGMGTEGSERQYTQLKVYENTNVEPKAETSTYEDMTETPSVAYESIRASPAALSRDPDYGNT